MDFLKCNPNIREIRNPKVKGEWEVFFSPKSLGEKKTSHFTIRKLRLRDTNKKT